MYRTAFILFPLLTLALMAAPADAQDDRWQLRVGAVWVDPDVDFRIVNDENDRFRAGADSAVGLGVALERRLSPRVGFELGALAAEPDLTLDADLTDGLHFRVSDGVRMTALTAGLNVHLTPDKPVDLYAGPLLGYVRFGDAGFRVQVGGQTQAEDFRSGEDFAFGAQIGADIAFGNSPWSINLAAKYLDASLEVTDDEGDRTDLGFDPLILSAGFGYRF